MSKKICLILLAAAAPHLSMLAKTETGNPTTDLYERHMQNRAKRATQASDQSEIQKQQDVLELLPQISLHDANQLLKKQLSDALIERDAAKEELNKTETELLCHLEKTLDLCQELENTLRNENTSLKDSVKKAAIVSTVAGFALGYAVAYYSK